MSQPYINEITDPANRTMELIQKWAKEIFTNKATRECDHSQQRSFEVKVSMFVLTFFDEAVDNDRKHNIGTEPPILQLGTQSKFSTLREKLEEMMGMRKQKQLIMFMMVPVEAVK
jgi:hypothetical protein